MTAIVDKIDTNEETDILGAFKSWNTISTVRCRPHTYDLNGCEEEKELQKNWFVPGALPWLKKDVVEARGEGARQELLARYLVLFLDYTTLLETSVVNRSIETIIHDRMGYGLSRELRLTGLKLYTDEAYHAVISGDVANQVSALYGITGRDACSERVSNIIALTAECEKEHVELAWFIVGFVSETVITKEFLKISQATVFTPVYNMLKDHLEDELKHAQYFSCLFKLVWCRSSQQEKDFISNFLPLAILEFFKLHKTWLYDNLRLSGVDAFNAALIHEELQGHDALRTRAKAGCTATLTAMRQSGYFKDRTNVERLVSAGLLDQQ